LSEIELIASTNCEAYVSKRAKMTVSKKSKKIVSIANHMSKAQRSSRSQISAKDAHATMCSDKKKYPDRFNLREAKEYRAEANKLRAIYNRKYKIAA
jgi:hypothetical protein